MEPLYDYFYRFRAATWAFRALPGRITNWATHSVIDGTQRQFRRRSPAQVTNRHGSGVERTQSEGRTGSNNAAGRRRSPHKFIELQFLGRR